MYKDQTLRVRLCAGLAACDGNCGSPRQWARRTTSGCQYIQSCVLHARHPFIFIQLGIGQRRVILQHIIRLPVKKVRQIPTLEGFVRVPPPSTGERLFAHFPRDAHPGASTQYSRKQHQAAEAEFSASHHPLGRLERKRRHLHSTNRGKILLFYFCRTLLNDNVLQQLWSYSSRY